MLLDDAFRSFGSVDVHFPQQEKEEVAGTVDQNILPKLSIVYAVRLVSEIKTLTK